MFLKRIYRMLKYFPKFIKESYSWQYETWQECGNAFCIMWRAKDDIWNEVTNTNDGGGGSYCVDCFIKMAEKRGIKINSWDIRLKLFYPNG